MATQERAARTEAEFVAWAEEIRGGSGGEMPFVWAIMRSPWVSLHWALIQDPSLDAGFRRSLKTRFPEHGESARDFLLELVATGAGADEHAGDAVLMLARLCDPLLNGLSGHRDARDLAVRLLDAEDSSPRRSSLIALGWVGEREDVDVLARCMRIDPDPECRVAASGALVQLLERHPDDRVRASVERGLRLGIAHEREPQVRAAVAEALEQIVE